MPLLHGFSQRSGDNIPLAPIFKPGKFGRIFPNLAGFTPPEAGLIALGQAMKEDPANVNNSAGDNIKIPAGFTYLGQFIDHDITFDTTTLTEAQVDPLAVHNFRTPKLDLDSLYSQGPNGQPYLYERPAPGKPTTKFVLGDTRDSPDIGGANIPGIARHDLARTTQGFATIGDPRNDENLIVAQLHNSMMRFHNKVVDKLLADGTPEGEVFDAARKLVTWHYQWIVLHDFLERLIEPAIIKKVLKEGRQFYVYYDEPFIPVEFSVAAYRLGHSMVREKYSYNRIFNSGPVKLAEATLALLFRFTGFSGTDVPVPSNWVIDWRRFFDLPRNPATDPPVGFSRKLDPFAVPALHALPGIPPGPHASLPVRNLLRGRMLSLPTGQAVAAAMGLKALTKAEIATGPDGAVAATHGFDVKTPLWYYILKEAQVKHAGERLGKVGSTILAEVFIGILQGDGNSFLAQAPEWKPTLPSTQPDNFTMADLLEFTGEVNPLG